MDSPPALDRLSPRDPGGAWLAVIEASQGTRHKLKYRADARAFELSHVLPPGMAFPCDFGFLPSTLADDGDPIDVLVLVEEALPVGTLVTCRLVGVIEAEQQEKGGRPQRNDRLIAVASESHRHRGVRSLRELGSPVVDAIESFFVAYNALRGRRFTPLARRGRAAAEALVKEALKRRAEEDRKAGPAGARTRGPKSR